MLCAPSPIPEKRISGLMNGNFAYSINTKLKLLAQWDFILCIQILLDIFMVDFKKKKNVLRGKNIILLLNVLASLFKHKYKLIFLVCQCVECELSSVY